MGDNLTYKSKQYSSSSSSNAYHNTNAMQGGSSPYTYKSSTTNANLTPANGRYYSTIKTSAILLSILLSPLFIYRMAHPTPVEQVGQVAQFTSHSPRINEIKSIPLLRASNYYDATATATAAKHKEYSLSSNPKSGHSSFGEDDGGMTGMEDSYNKKYYSDNNSFQQSDRQKQVRSSPCIFHIYIHSS